MTATFPGNEATVLELPPIPAIPAEFKFKTAIAIKTDLVFQERLKTTIRERGFYTLSDNLSDATVIISDTPSILEGVHGRHVIKMLVVRDEREKRSHQDTSHAVTRTASEILLHFSR